MEMLKNGDQAGEDLSIFFFELQALLKQFLAPFISIASIVPSMQSSVPKGFSLSQLSRDAYKRTSSRSLWPSFCSALSHPIFKSAVILT
jgi:hypothetical protein